MEVNLTCSICLQDYDTVAHVPLIVGKCGHVICKHCVDKIFIANRGTVCPFDKRPLEHPTKNLINFPRHFELLRKIYLQKQQKEAENGNHDTKDADYIALEIEPVESDPDTHINQKLDASFEIRSWRGGYAIKPKENIYESDAAMHDALKRLEDIVKQGFGFYLTSINIKLKEGSRFEPIIQILSHLQSLLKVECELIGHENLFNGFIRNVSAVLSLEELSIKCKAEHLSAFPEIFEKISESLPGLRILSINLSQAGLSSIRSLNKGIEGFKELQHLDLNLSGNPQIVEEDLIILAATIPKLSLLTTLSLNFKEVVGVNGKVLLEVKSALQSLSNLMYVYLDFSNIKTLTYDNLLKLIECNKAPGLKIFTLTVEDCGYTYEMISKIAQKLDEMGDQVFTRIKPSLYEMNSMRVVDKGVFSLLNIPLLIFVLPVMLIYIPMILAAAIALSLQDKDQNANQFAKVIVKFPYHLVCLLAMRFVGVCRLIMRGKLFNREAIVDLCIDI